MTTIQVRRDTAANLASVNPVLNSGELCNETNTGKLKIGDGQQPYNSLDSFAYEGDVKHACKLADKLYDGVDLSVKFAKEIANYSDVWAWIKARITAGNYEGIHVGDKIPFQLSAGTVGSDSIPAKNMWAQIAGIDTYYGNGYAIANNNGACVAGHHIDFISTECIPKTIQWNPTDNNNGTLEQNNPWLASKLYAYLNGVNNYTTSAYNNVAHGFDASAGGVLQLLPMALQNVITMKSLYLGKKYSASGLLNTHSASHDIWGIGKLWVPTEIEVYGCAIHSAEKAADGKDYNNFGAPVQYPLFAGANGYTQNRCKKRLAWWLLSPCGGSSSDACYVSYIGGAYANGCAHTNVCAPVCFRI